jgi:tripartite motif-containing protein 43/48/49/64/77
LNSEGCNWLAAWGAQSFTPRKPDMDYWELDMDDSWDWALGIFRDSGMKKKPSVIESFRTYFFFYVSR